MVQIEEIRNSAQAVITSSNIEITLENIIVLPSNDQDPPRVLDPASGADQGGITFINPEIFRIEDLGYQNLETFTLWCDWRVSQINADNAKQACAQKPEDITLMLQALMIQSSVQEKADKYKDKQRVLYNQITQLILEEKMKNMIIDTKAEFEASINVFTNENNQHVLNTVQGASQQWESKVKGEYHDQIEKLRSELKQDQAKLFEQININANENEEEFNKRINKIWDLTKLEVDKLAEDNDKINVYLKNTKDTTKLMENNFKKLEQNVQDDLKESRMLVKDVIKDKQREWENYSKELREKLKLIIPKGNQKELNQLITSIGEVATELSSIKVSLNDAAKQRVLAFSKQEKKSAKELSTALETLETRNYLIFERTLKGYENTNNLIIQAIQEMVVKITDHFEACAPPTLPKESDNTLYSNQLIFVMIDKYPKIKDMLQLKRTKDHQIIFVPKEERQKEFEGAVNSFILRHYQVENTEELKQLMIDDWELVTLSKYKGTSSSRTSPPRNKGKEPFKEYLASPSKPILSKNPRFTSNPPHKMTDDMDFEPEMMADINKRFNQASSASNFSDDHSYRKYKISKANLTAIRHFLRDYTNETIIPDNQPQPFLAENQGIIKKSPLDVFGMKPPEFNGDKRTAKNFVRKFTQFVNSYVSINSLEYYIKNYILYY
ncbi:hypothetical protein BCR32DRAFT_285559 [Anaeromyces robustus]|uniref:Uncharacterized protein n=1 Tax=Anaeromyces robustus TaxID=1754192 RepID=A0A1Y1WJM1_9FUNG|nr:hypothetical protein BCR32DRAFT_285559 [Anaeromyces robustus]|eukprot:ORX73528.1 hypothetical protein BCR32DRAFT_285559 [Anaeromyces robustus]